MTIKQTVPIVKDDGTGSHDKATPVLWNCFFGCTQTNGTYIYGSD
ncbi:hypothetical protein M2010_003815 [Providencia stuartii]|nr:MULTISPECIES: hypothetical protein [Providencia]GHC05763.1 hypothetical protein GCM10007290_38300 [Providencia thailandensis]